MNIKEEFEYWVGSLPSSSRTDAGANFNLIKFHDWAKEFKEKLKDE